MRDEDYALRVLEDFDVFAKRLLDKNEYSEATLNGLQSIEQLVKLCYVMVYTADLLFSGDLSEEEFARELTRIVLDADASSAGTQH